MSPPHTGREKMGSPTLQTHQYLILLLPWLWFEVADQTLTHLATTRMLGHSGVSTLNRTPRELRAACAGDPTRAALEVAWHQVTLL